MKECILYLTTNIRKALSKLACGKHKAYFASVAERKKNKYCYQ
jgi:hypothetical protein